MFDLDRAISDWRQELFRAGLQRPEVLDELESHLHDDVAKQIRTGTNEQTAFEAAAQQIGQTKLIKMEFKKIETRARNRPLAWFAWGLFIISFFLPAYSNGLGWQCAMSSLTAWSWPEMKTGEWLTIHMALLSFANLFMVASPFFLSRFSRNKCFSNWLRFTTFAAFALVWSFFLIFFFHSERRDLKIGSYVWTSSFLLLFLSSFLRRKQKEQYV